MKFAFLLLAAVLEVGGDALVREGLYGRGLRPAFMVCGALILFAYGVLVNLSPADFGKALGVYVALFFVVAQLVNWIGFGIAPGPPVLVGGLLICAGGAVLALWQ